MSTSIRTLSVGLFAAGLAGAPAALAEEASPAGPLDLANLSLSAAFTTEYMFRGISNTDGPAVQASLDWTYRGFYLGAWGSNTQFSDADIEIDYYGGYRGELAGFGYDLGAVYYTYPGEDEDGTDAAGKRFDPAGGQEANYFELQFVLGRSFAVPGSPSLSVKYNYSPDFFGEDGEAHAVQGDVSVTVPLGLLGPLVLGGSLGYQDVEGDQSSGSGLGLLEWDQVTPLDGFDYVWWRAGLSKEVAGFKVEGSYYATDLSDDLKGLYASAGEPTDFSDLIDHHFVLTVSRSFSLP